MKILHFSLAIFSLIALGGWITLSHSSSPNDDLESVAYTAFVSHAPSLEAGNALAEAARGWKGVTAATYNLQSGLLVVAHKEFLTSADLKRLLSPLTSATPEIKKFDTRQGPQCPVPFEYIAIIPKLLLGLFLISAGFLVLSFVRSRRPQLTQVT